jgi:outer membrane protein assembly factor BamB
MRFPFSKVFPLLLLSTVIAPAGDWPTFRGDMQRTGYYAGPVGYPKKEPVWIASLGCEFISSPSVADKTLYIGGRDSCLYAIDAATGHVLWKKKTDGWVDSSPLFFDGNVYVGSRDQTIYALNADGREILRMEAGMQLSSPAMTANGVIITGLGPPYNAIAGYQPAGKAGLGKAAAQWSIEFSQMSYSSPSVFGQTAVLGASDGFLYMVDTDTKRIAWRLKTDGGVYLSTPAIGKEEARVYFAPGNYDYSVYSVDLLSGKVIWKSEGSPDQSLGKKLKTAKFSPEMILDLLRYKPSDRPMIAARLLGRPGQSANLATMLGKKAAEGWTPLGEMKTSSVAVAPDNVYVIQKALGLQETQVGGAADQRSKPMFTILALDKSTGGEAWRFSELRDCVRLGYCSSPVVTEHSLFFGWGEGMVYMLDRHTGALQWSDTLTGDIISSPAIAHGNLYIATMAGNIYCFKLQDSPPGLDFQRSTYCYPNPARGLVSHIQVFVGKAGTMDMALYNSAEKPVFKLSRQISANEKYSYDWDLSRVANGVYFAIVKVQYADGTKDKKVLKVAVLK